MKLKSLKYSQHKDKPNQWSVKGCTFEDIQLIVGKNATGKTRLLNVINGLAKILSRYGKLPFLSGDYNVQFDKKGKHIEYVLRYEGGKVSFEKLTVNNDVVLKRHRSGKGKIRSIKLKKELEFQIPKDEVAVFAKRDSVQHPFLDDLYSWADSLIHFAFSSDLGKPLLLSSEEALRDMGEIDPKDTMAVLRKFKNGEDKFGNKFISSILCDMASIGYDIDDIDIRPPISVKFKGLPAPIGFLVKETDLTGPTDQNEMSQGMFRAFSLIVQTNYSQFARIPSCILIDDIGEGLDFERSISLINLITGKVQNTLTQLIMATNDRFVMNAVPLKYWSIIHRSGNTSQMFNRRNLSKIFNEFELTGLNNFDFFSSEYFLRHIKQK